MTNEVEAVCGTAAGVATAAKSCLGGHLEEGNRAVGEM